MSEPGPSVNNDDGRYECPVCYEYMLPPIFQCHNGHLVCKVCQPQLSLCPVCREKLPRKPIRNLAVESIVVSKTYPCPFASKGCQETLRCDMMETHKNDCPFASVNYCSYLGYRDCSECSSPADLVIHASKVHNMYGLYVDPGNMVEVEIQQLGAEPNQIQTCEVEWRPNYIVLGDKTFFLRTKLMGGNISWAVSILGGADKAKDMRATIMFRTSDPAGAVLTWNGAITDLKTGFDDNNIFTMPSQRLIGLPNWTLTVQIGLEQMQASGPLANSSHKITSRSHEVIALGRSPRVLSGNYASAMMCSACEIPIAGPRFKCSECPGYDLCKSCCIEKNLHSEHVFLLATSTAPSVADKMNRAARKLQDRSPLRSLFGRPFRSGTPIPTDSHSSSDSSTESEPSSDDDNDSFPNMEEDDIMASMDAEQWATPEDDWY